MIKCSSRMNFMRCWMTRTIHGARPTGALRASKTAFLLFLRHLTILICYTQTAVVRGSAPSLKIIRFEHFSSIGINRAK